MSQQLNQKSKVQLDSQTKFVLKLIINQNHNIMLRWTITFIIIAFVAAILGFGGVAGAAAGVAKILFFLFLVLAVISIIKSLVKS